MLKDIESPLFFKILSQVSDPVFILSTDFKFMWANDAYSKYMKLDLDSIISKELEVVIPPEYSPVLKKKFQIITQKAPSFDNIYPSALSDGSIIIEKWHNEGVFTDEGKLKHYYCIATLKEKEEGCEDTMSKTDLVSSTLIRSSLLGIIVAIEGKISYINKKTWEILGLSAGVIPENLELGDFFRMILPEYSSDITENESNSKIINDEVSFTRPDGQKCWISIVRKQQRLKKTSTNLILIEEITERKEIEEALRAAKEEAEVSERLKTAFLANMSHEIRTPLNAILGFSDLLTRNPTLEEQNKFNKIIKQSSTLLLNIIDDILDISSIESGNLDLNIEQVSVEELFETMSTIFSDRQSSEINLIFEEIRNNISVQADRERLKQVLINLISNAYKYTSKGYIKISCKMDKEKEQAVFIVKDSGRGIEPEKQSRIFDRFYQTDSFSKGTGLGLAITRSLLEQMNGSISVSSKTGEGAKFSFSLPLT